MAASLVSLRLVSSILKNRTISVASSTQRLDNLMTRCLSSGSSNGITGDATTNSSREEALHKFDKVIEKVKINDADSKQDLPHSNENLDSFATMIRKSKLVALGEDNDKRVTGKIIEVMDDDLYIDFGGKFHCVCPRPRKNGHLYQRGKAVLVSLKTQEMSSAFLGSDTHITLLEADGILLGLQTQTGGDSKIISNTRKVRENYWDL